MTLTLTSPAFSHQGEIPARYTCEGEDLSPPLAWSDAPEGTMSLALIVDDPDAIEAFKRLPRKSHAHHAYLAAAYARLGRDEAAQAEVRAVLELKPDFSVEGYVASLPYKNEADRESHKKTLLEAGLPA